MTIKELINKILLEVNLAEYCNNHYGANFNLNAERPFSNCIFHKESTPSLQYNRDSNTIKCWAKCYSDKIDAEFLESPINIFAVVGIKEGLETKGQDFMEILKIICGNTGIPLDIEGRKVDPKIQELKEYKTNLAMFYHDNLKDDKNSNHLIHAYLRNDRGIKPQTIADFKLGLTSENEAKYGRNFMSNRLSIPIFSDDGSYIVAISGRQLTGSSNEPKYKHDETDAIWKKGEMLYGYAHAKAYAKSKRHVYVVEGFFDMISLYQAGIKNVVAVMSNNVTVKQMEKIKSLAPNVTFILDQDEAGMKAFTPTLELALRNGLNVKVVTNLAFKGKDANDLCINLDWNESAISSFLYANSKDAIQYILSDVYDKYDERILQARYEALRFSNSVLELISDPIKRRNYQSYMDSRLGL